MLKLKKIKPVGCQVLVTKNLYGWDDFDEGGILIHQRGDLKRHQTVIAVGDDVSFTKPGDIVDINFYKYAVFKEDPSSIKAANDNPIVGLRLKEVEMVDTEGEPITCILIDQRDINYIIEDMEEVAYKESKLIKVKQPKKQLILPDNKIKV